VLNLRQHEASMPPFVAFAREPLAFFDRTNRSMIMRGTSPLPQDV